MKALIIPNLSEEQRLSFWSRVFKKEKDNCWLWLGNKNQDGYGRLSIKKRRFKTHRLSWAMINGPVPERMCVLHHCDNPGCVNPHHLFLGTHADNMHDMKNKGRNQPNYGTDNGMAKLTPDIVKHIRNNRDISSAIFARMYGVCPSAIRQARRKHTWKVI